MIEKVRPTRAALLRMADLHGITLGEYLELAAFEMVTNEEFQIEVPVSHGGAVYILAIKLKGMMPPADAESILERVH